MSVLALRVVGGSLDSGPVTANWTSGPFFPSLLGSFLGTALGSDACLLQPLQPPNLCISQEPGPRDQQQACVWCQVSGWLVPNEVG